MDAPANNSAAAPVPAGNGQPFRSRRTRIRVTFPAWASLLALLAAGCADKVTDPPPSKAVEIRILAGDDQQSEPGAPLRDSLAVRVTDRDGAGVAGVRVDFVVTSGGGSATPVQRSTDEGGIARAAWTLGTGAGEQRLDARSSGVPAVTFRARAIAREPATGLELVKGDSQVGYAAAVLADTLVVRVTDRHGHVVRDAMVQFSVESGGGSVIQAVASDSAGVARTRWTLGAAPGGQRVSARLDNGAGQPVLFRALALEDLRVEKSGMALVDDLVGRLQTAGDEAARTRAVMYIAQAISVGIYTRKGEPVVIGAERGPLDFYLYDFQVPLIARAQARGQYWSVAEMAELLTGMEIRPGDDPLPPQMLWDALKAAAEQALAQPSHPRSLLPLLLRELGLRQAVPYDLAAAASMDGVRFDALQNWLLLVALGRPLVSESPPSTPGSGLVQLSSGILRHAPHGSPRAAPPAAAAALAAGAGGDPSWCTKMGVTRPEDSRDINNWALERFLERIGNVGKTIVKTAKLSGVILDGVHGMILAYGVQVTTPDEWLKTHYGHDADGAALHFRVKVEMLDDLGTVFVECGWIAAVEFPPAGPIAGVTVRWSEAEGELRPHGTLACGTPCTTVTAADGIATLVFRPRREVVAGRGSCPGGGAFACSEESGIISGTALYQSRFGNLLIGGAAQFLTPKYSSTRWTVEYHRLPRELEIMFETQVTLEDEPDDGLYTGSMRSTFRMVLREGNTASPADPQQRYVGQGGFTYEFSFAPATQCPPILRGHRVTWQTSAGMAIREGQPLELYFTPGTWMETWTTRYMEENACVNEHTGEFLARLVAQWIDHHEHELFNGPFFRLDEYQYSFRLRNFSGTLQDGLLTKVYNITSYQSTERTRIEIRVVTP
jgi:hypothetical protein